MPASTRPTIISIRPTLQLLQRLFKDEAFRGAARKLRISEPQQPLARLGFDRFGLEQVGNRQHLAKIQTSLPARHPCGPLLLRIRTIYPDDSQ